MQKEIERIQINEVVSSMNALTASKEKNIITLRCEKIGKKIDEIAGKLNEELATINAEYASTDEKGNFLHEEVIITDKTGASKKESTGNYKYTFARNEQRKKAIEKFWKEKIEIPCNVIKRTDSNNALYKQIIEKLNFTQLSVLAGIILDIPLDEEGFIDDQWVLDFLAGDEKAKQNGQASKSELSPSAKA